jgi:Tfp pilus assembly protein PilW
MSLATWKQILGMFVGLTLMSFLCAIAMLLGCFVLMGVVWVVIACIGFIRVGIEQF